MDLSVVIPLFNEEKRIPSTLKKIVSYLSKSKLSYEVVLVDDGSQDNTLRVVSKAAQGNKQLRVIELNKNMGKGWAVRVGVLKAKGKFILFSDADLSTPIEEEFKLREKLKNGYDVAIASRVQRDGQDERTKTQPLRRRILGKFFNFLVNSLVVTGFRDTQCGFKMFTKQAAQKIFLKQKIKRIAFDVELLYLALKEGLRIAEVPIKWQGGQESRMNVLRELGVLKDILWIRFSH